MEPILTVPGLRGSPPEHWQTWIESQLPGCHRVEQSNWEQPCLRTWARRVREEIDAAESPPWIIAHSFGCLATVAAVQKRPGGVRGALLVAPADPDRFGIPHELLETALGFPCLVAASETDPWIRLPTAQRWARAWGGEFVNIGPAGHINVDSGHGPWPSGLGLFEALRETGP